MATENINAVTSLGTWIKEMLESKPGTLVIGLFMGLVLATPFYLTEKNNNEKLEQEISEIKIALTNKEQQIDALKTEIYEAEKNRLEYIKEIIETMKALDNYFVDTKDVMNKIKTETLKSIDEQKQIIYKANHDE